MKFTVKWFEVIILIMLCMFLYTNHNFDIIRIKYLYSNFDDTHVKTRLFNGMPIIVNKVDKIVCKSIRETGVWDPVETKAILPLFKPRQTVVEVGANYGYYTLLIAEKIGKSGKLISYEANPDVYKYLIKSVAMNHFRPPMVTVKNLAVADHKDTAVLVYGFDNIGGGFISNIKDEKANCQNGNGFICHRVATTSLDEDLGNIKIDILRMDAEGSEYFILKGAKKILSNSPNAIIIMEWGQMHFQRVKININDFIELLKEQKYFIYNIVSPGYLINIGPNDLLKVELSNIVLSKQKI
ncbi:MAG: FkbM family methyltransferase [Gammaproteobacteria bacterium]|jgi:FkbM family methyltransferase